MCELVGDIVRLLDLFQLVKLKLALLVGPFVIGMPLPVVATFQIYVVAVRDLK